MKEENYKFRLSEFVEPLIAWLEANPQGVFRTSSRRFHLTHFSKSRRAGLQTPSSAFHASFTERGWRSLGLETPFAA